jgi:hypothetical protein
VRKIRPNSGLIHYEPRTDTLEWSQALKGILADEKPAAIVVMLGLDDRVSLRVLAPPRQAAHEDKEKQSAQKQEKGEKPGAGTSQPAQAKQSGEGEKVAAEPNEPAPGSYEFRSDVWAKLYRKRVDDMMGALKSKGVPVLWVGLPALRGPHATADMSYLDDIYRAGADKGGIDYVDVWDGFVDDSGRYSVMGPDFEGQTRRLRSADGVHFTKYGALKLAHLVDQELSRAIANPTPAILPTPQASAPAKPGAARSAVGPVLPLTTAGGERANDVGGGRSGQLLGGSAAAPADPDPTAAGVLVHGTALPAPTDRADNFAWPPGAGANPTQATSKPGAGPVPSTIPATTSSAAGAHAR